MEANALKERLHSIQEQQKERFKERKATQRGVLKESNRSILISAHQGEDDLDLRTATQVANSDCEQSTTDYSKEVDFLRHQLEHLQLENAQFRSNLKEKDMKLAEIEKCREEEKIAFGGIGTSATQKIVELSKRNRELNSDLASEKNRVRQLQKKFKELERAAVSCDNKEQVDCLKNERTHTCTTVSKTSGAGDDSSSVIAHLHEQLKHAQQKMTDHRNQCQVLKQELKLAQKVITKEVGESVSMSAILSGVSGWRGRAQQITTLQKRVAELKEQLERHQPGTTRGASTSRGDFISAQTDVRQKAMLQKMEKERKATLDETRLELEMLQSEHSKLKRQNNALRARNKILTAELKQMKSQLSSNEQHQAQQGAQHARTPSMASTLDEECSPRYQGWRKERKMLQEANDSLQEHLKRCLIELQSLKRDQQQATKSSSRQKTKSINGITLPPVVPPPGSRRGHRLSEVHLERKSLSAGHVLPAIQQSQPDSKSIETSTLAQVTQIERDRLLQLTNALQQRLDATTGKLLRLETELRNQKQHTIRLEKKLGRLHGASDKSGGHKEDVGDLEMRLEIQMDENAVLKETLELTRHEKMEDMKLYRTMLQETKKLFMDSVRKIQNKTVT